MTDSSSAEGGAGETATATKASRPQIRRQSRSLRDSRSESEEVLERSVVTEEGKRMNDDGWMTYKTHSHRIEVLDAMGRVIDAVRAVRPEGDGVRVRILASAGGQPAALAEDGGGFMHVCEFEGFVRGGSIRRLAPRPALVADPIDATSA
jgi:hypothetical protein